MSVKVAVIDDQEIIRLGIQQALSGGYHLVFVDGFSSLEAFFRSDVCRSVNVILLDDSLPDIDAIQAIQIVQELCPDAAVLLLGSRLTPGGIHQAIKAGASGVVCKNESLQDILLMGIRHAHAGKVYLSPDAALIAMRLGSVPLISRRLHEVLKLIARGYRVPMIMQELGISQKAVYRRKHRLCEILGVETNEQIVAEAIRLGLLRDEE